MAPAVFKHVCGNVGYTKAHVVDFVEAFIRTYIGAIKLEKYTQDVGNYKDQEEQLKESILNHMTK